MRKLLTSEECVGKTVEEADRDDDLFYIHFTDGSTLIVAAMPDGDDGAYVTETTLGNDRRCRKLGMDELWFCGVANREERDAMMAESRRKDSEAKEATERAQLARLKAKYEGTTT